MALPLKNNHLKNKKKMINMEVKEKYESSLNNSQLVLLGFELNRSQSALILILSFIGLFMATNELVMGISFNLFQFIFVVIPAYLDHPEVYADLYLYYYFAPVITGIIISSIFLLLSVYGLKKVLSHNDHNDIKKKSKRKTIQQDRIVNWLGLKLSHGQSLFIFSLSLIGILFTIQFYINSTTYLFRMLEDLCFIPTGSNSATSHEILLDNVPIVISAIFIVLCIYSIIASRRGKPASPPKRIVKNYGLIIFIGSFIIFLFILIRFFSHLFLFTDLADILGMTPNAINSYQTKDFFLVMAILIICLILMTSSYFLKESPNEDTKINNKITWLHITLTPKRAIILLSLAILGIIVFGYPSLVIFFIMGGWYLFFYFNSYTAVFSLIFLIIPCILVIFICYAIGKVVKKHRLKKFLDEIENSEEITCKWFKYNLNLLNSVIFFSLSIAFSIYYIFSLILLNMNARMVITGISIPESVNIFDEFLWIIRFVIMMSVNSLLLAVSIYTIKKTKYSIKSR
jgi:hypothetical protein